MAATSGYVIERFTEKLASLSLLQTRYYELIEESDLRVQGGDFQYQRSSELLAEIRQAMKDLRLEIDIMKYKLPESKMGIPGKSWDYTTATDKSFDDIKRSVIDKAFS